MHIDVQGGDPQECQRGGEIVISLHDIGYYGLAKSHPMYERSGHLREVGRHPQHHQCNSIGAGRGRQPSHSSLSNQQYYSNKVFGCLYETMVPQRERVPIARVADFQLNQEVPLIQQYVNYKMIFDTMEPSLHDKLFANNVLNCSDLAQLWRVESTWLLVLGKPINIAQVCNIVDRQSKGLEKGLKTPTMTKLLAMNASPGYYIQEPSLNANWVHQTSPHQASPQYWDMCHETPPIQPLMAE